MHLSLNRPPADNLTGVIDASGLPQHPTRNRDQRIQIMESPSLPDHRMISIPGGGCPHHLIRVVQGQSKAVRSTRQRSQIRDGAAAIKEKGVNLMIHGTPAPNISQIVDTAGPG